MIEHQTYIQEVEMRNSSFGFVQYIRVRRYDGKPMYWSEVCQAFNDSHPGKWAIQIFFPQEEVIDEANIYHLFILDGRPTNLGIFSDP